MSSWAGSKLVLSADTAIPIHEHRGAGYIAPMGSIKLSVGSISCLLTEQSRNVTEEHIAGCDLTPLVGGVVVFDIEVSGGAMLYTLSFGN